MVSGAADHVLGLLEAAPPEAAAGMERMEPRSTSDHLSERSTDADPVSAAPEMRASLRPASMSSKRSRSRSSAVKMFMPFFLPWKVSAPSESPSQQMAEVLDTAQACRDGHAALGLCLCRTFEEGVTKHTV